MTSPRFGAAPSKASRNLILGIVGILFIIPILAMLQFTFQAGQPVRGVQAYSVQHYVDLFNPANESTYDPLFQGVQNSLVIALFTVLIILVLLLPSMILIELKFPRFRRVLEFVCLIPITIPTVVLVVGFIPAYRVVAQIFGSTPYTLAFAIGVICLPYAFRPIATNLAAVEVTTLSEAARSLGAGWPQVMVRIILPNLRRGILSAVLLTVAVVLGEYTIASFLSQTTFQTALLLIQQTDPYAGVIFAVFALIFVFILLVVLGRVGTFGSAGPTLRKRGIT